MSIYLTVNAGTSPVGLSYPDGTEITIGREIGNSIAPVAAEGLSRRHAKIVSRDGKWTIEDLGSTNGTFVNGKKIDSPAEIKPGDKISCGKFGIAVETLPAPVADIVPELPAAEPQKAVEPPPAPVAPLEKKNVSPIVPAAAAPAAEAPAAAKPAAAKPAPITPVKPIVKPGLKPGLKLPPGRLLIKPGLKLPAAKPGLKPGLKLPPKPGLKVPPKQ